MLMEAQNIKVSFKKENQTKLFGKERQPIVRDVSLNLRERECLGIIGESGSGKSTLLKVLSGLLTPDEGQVFAQGVLLYNRFKKKPEASLSTFCSIVFQDYTSSVNPRFKVSDILDEGLRVLSKKLNTPINKAHYYQELLEQVGLDDRYLDRYPHQLSGGQLQRVCIARAIAVRPKVILLDEAISSLDASTQIQIMDLLIKLRETHHFSYVFVTHDLTAITYLCDRVLFFHEGKIVEEVSKLTDLSEVKTDYAKELLSAVMGLDLLKQVSFSFKEKGETLCRA